ncbi:flagellum-specific ATP synthase FliI [Meridianimarinicoccus roseus]|uniref:Flagellum-specific ATP synthase FliI n=1 Tax=Meridianimarinicoccus roseus TaxID=2072018 RepID=A0A2V2LSF3_9RHOB|nr:FliI/YscN family ATPase [Meridianimarinicoccus roseus]PWR04373.1 flagellum-specific ATP synthase FliI [Meridianimarinicoccus roseus]
MTFPGLENLTARIASIQAVFPVGRVVALNDLTISVSGLGRTVSLGDRVQIRSRSGALLGGEVLRIDPMSVEVLPSDPPAGLSLADPVMVLGPPRIAPDASWIGRIVDPDGKPLDGRPIFPGTVPVPLSRTPPAAARRRPLGARIEAGIAAFNTVLPVVSGQRLGLFAGSGVGKSTLLGMLARNLDADVVVIALIGERGRELRHFVDEVLGKDGMRRSVVVAATSDQSALQRRRCALSAMCVAEHFRDRGAHVLFIADSITRFAEAHRDVALAAGEAAGPGGFPPSMPHQIMALAERAGPGIAGAGDITGIFSVLVAGSDMEGPVADTLRGVLDGHVVLDRKIAERGRYPAIDLLQSVSRSLPTAATEVENTLISEARRLLGAYDKGELMIQSGLYAAGADPVTDKAVRCWGALDGFLGRCRRESVSDSFRALANAVEMPDAVPPSAAGGPDEVVRAQAPG